MQSMCSFVLFLGGLCLMWALSETDMKKCCQFASELLSSVLQFPFGRRLPCDIYWHGVSFHDNYIFSGQVNKFPGTSFLVLRGTSAVRNRTALTLCAVPCGTHLPTGWSHFYQIIFGRWIMFGWGVDIRMWILNSLWAEICFGQREVLMKRKPCVWIYGGNCVRLLLRWNRCAAIVHYPTLWTVLHLFFFQIGNNLFCFICPAEKEAESRAHQMSF